jgi:hypothetical protein
VRRLLALSVTTACVVGLTSGLTAGTAAAATSPTRPKVVPTAPFTQPVVKGSAVKQLVRKGPAVAASASRSRSLRQLDVSGPATAIINVTYTGFPAQAHDAFAAAVNIWAHTIHSSVPIEVSADWSDLTSIYGPGVLGAAGPTDFVSHVPNAPVQNQNTYYPIALANAISGTDLLKANGCTNSQFSPTGAEISASFNSTESDWYYGTDGNVPGSGSAGGPKVDLESVVLHELGHGLGFTGTYEGLNPQTGDDQGLGYFGLLGDGTLPTIFDSFASDGGGNRLLGNYSSGSPSLGGVLRGVSGGVRWGGSAGTAANGGTQPVLYAPTQWEEGSSFSHLSEATYPASSGNGLMSPILNAGEAEHDPGPIVLGMFQDMGWPASATVPAASPGYYHAVQPVPISRLKSQTGIKAGVAIDVPVTGHFGVPANVTAVVVNVEVKLPTSKGYWTTLPGCKGGPGLPASGDFSAGLSRTGQATLPVSATGHIEVMSSSAASAVNVDLVGWYSAAGELAYHHLQNQQVAALTNISTAQQLDVLVAGKAGIPTTGVSAVVLKTRISAGTANAYLAVGPGGQNSQMPSFSFSKGEMVSNFLTVPIGTGAAAGKVHLRLTAGKATVSLEAVGWYGPKAAGGLVFHPTGPARYGVPLNGQDQIAGGLPGNTQVLLTVHLANPTATGYLGSSPAGPGALHGVQEYHAGQPVSGTIITTTNSLGQVRLRLSAGKSPLYVDWLGYYAAT